MSNSPGSPSPDKGGLSSDATSTPVKVSPPGGVGLLEIKPPWSIYLKAGILLFLILMLWIPLVFIQTIVADRARLQRQVVTEIGSQWGRQQTLTGPILAIPYTYVLKTTLQSNDGKVTTKSDIRRSTLFVMPERLTITGKIVPKERYRGIYRTTVYNASLALNGHFALPDFTKLGIDSSALELDKARLILGVTDPRSLPGDLSITFGGNKYSFRPDTAAGGLLRRNGVHASVKINSAPERPEKISFAARVQFAGSRTLSFIPVAKITNVSLVSSWQHPSFNGVYLPRTRSIGHAGFKANWQVSYLGRGFPSIWKASGSSRVNTMLHRKVERSAFGVSLVRPVNRYAKSERAVKYGLLFVVIVFAAIFVMEVLTRASFHPAQYALVGLAISVFYLLLLSFSEVIGFGPAYGLAVLLSATLLAIYIGRTIPGRWSIPVVGVLLAGVYSFLYVLLQLEDMALLAGSLALFAMVALVMYVTRNLDWNTFTAASKNQREATDGPTATPTRETG